MQTSRLETGSRVESHKSYVYTRALRVHRFSRSFQIQRAEITYFLLSPPAVERNRIIVAGKINTGEAEGPEERPSREQVLRMS